MVRITLRPRRHEGLALAFPPEPLMRLYSLLAPIWPGRSHLVRKAVDGAELRLMRRIAEGDEGAFRELAGLHAPRMLRLAGRMMRGTAEAEEVVQEALLRLWQEAGRWDPARGRLGTWLHVVTTRLCLDQLRRKQPLPLDDVAMEMLADGEPDALTVLLRDDELQALRQAMASLPARQRVAVALFYLEELPGQEAAEAMGLSLRAFWSLLHRARAALFESLDETMPTETTR